MSDLVKRLRLSADALSYGGFALSYGGFDLDAAQLRQAAARIEKLESLCEGVADMLEEQGFKDTAYLMRLGFEE